MENELTTGLSLDIIRWMQTTSTPALDVLAQLLNFMGSNRFYVLVIIAAFLAINREVGWRLFFAWIVTFTINNLLKLAFEQPRPFHIDANISIPETAASYGFPSGHVMNAVVMWGTAWIIFRRPFFRWAMVLIPVLMAWARMYSGVHYFQDVVGGAFFGVLLLLLMPYLLRIAQLLRSRFRLQRSDSAEEMQ